MTLAVAAAETTLNKVIPRSCKFSLTAFYWLLNLVTGVAKG